MRGSGARCRRTASRHGERRRSSRASRRRPSLPMARDAGEAVSASQERSRASRRRGHERAPDHHFAESLGAGDRRDLPGASDQASAGAGRRRPGRRRDKGGPSLPRREPASRSACPARGRGGGLLSFLESLIGGASLLGTLKRPTAPAQAPTGEKDTAPSALSAEAFRDAVRACKAESRDDRQALKREAQLERQRQINELLDQHVSGSQWSGMLDRAKLAASGAEQEFMMLRFPSDLCSDGGRKIDVAEEGWEGTLRGLAAELYSRWRTELKPQGFGLSARIVSYEDGIIGDIGLFLTWKGD